METFLIMALVVFLFVAISSRSTTNSSRIRRLTMWDTRVKAFHSTANINNHQLARLSKHRAPRKFREQHISEVWDEAFTLLVEQARKNNEH